MKIPPSFEVDSWVDEFAVNPKLDPRFANGKYILHDGVVWYQDQCLHREDGPAIIWLGRKNEWWLNGLRHRTDGPAIDYVSGRKDWYRYGKRHRTDGPAIEYSEGGKEWWLDDRRHRIDGPAKIWHDGRKEWWIRHRPCQDIDDWGRRLGIFGIDDFVMLKLEWG